MDLAEYAYNRKLEDYFEARREVVEILKEVRLQYPSITQNVRLCRLVVSYDQLAEQALSNAIGFASLLD